MCGTICLESSGSDLITRVGNAVYEQCRGGQLSVPGFPAFDPVLQALRAGCAVERSSTYKVCCQRAGNLLVLESLAQKWVTNPLTADRALETIKGHNDEFNASGDYWITDRNMFFYFLGGTSGERET